MDSLGDLRDIVPVVQLTEAKGMKGFPDPAETLDLGSLIYP